MSSTSLVRRVVIAEKDTAERGLLEPASRARGGGGAEGWGMMMLVPYPSTCRLMKLRKPSPAASTRITVEMPIIIPSVVSTVRVGLRRKSRTAWFNDLIVMDYWLLLRSLLISQGIDGIEFGCFESRVEAENYAGEYGYSNGQDDRGRGDDIGPFVTERSSQKSDKKGNHGQSSVPDEPDRSVTNG